jgi:hypothetical protein
MMKYRYHITGGKASAILLFDVYFFLYQPVFCLKVFLAQNVYGTFVRHNVIFCKRSEPQK